MIVPLLLGSVGALGFWLFLTGLKPKPAPLLVLLNNLEQPARQQPPSLIEGSLSRLLPGQPSTQLKQDLAMLNRSMADHARSKLRNAALLIGFPITAAVLAMAVGFFVPPVLLMAAVVVSGAAGWVITEGITHANAVVARSEFRSTLVTYLQLVCTLLAGGAGANEALNLATKFGHGRGFTEINQALTEARLRGISPWDVFAQVAQTKGLNELDELAAAVELAGTSGARVRTSLMSKAASLRHSELTQMKATAEAASESMGIPIGIMMLSFILLIGFPAIITIMSV